MRFTALKMSATIFSDTLFSSKSGFWILIHSFKSIEANGMLQLRRHLLSLKYNIRILQRIIIQGLKKKKARLQIPLQ